MARRRNKIKDRAATLKRVAAMREAIRLARESGEELTCRVCHTSTDAQSVLVHGNQIVCHSCNRTRAKRSKEKNPFNTRLHVIRSRCHKLGSQCHLTETDLRDLWEAQQGRCHYSGLPMNLLVGGRNDDPMGFSVDRIDSNKGYVATNVVLCLRCINHFKGRMTTEEMLLVVAAMSRHSGSPV